MRWVLRSLVSDWRVAIAGFEVHYLFLQSDHRSSISSPGGLRISCEVASSNDFRLCLKLFAQSCEALSRKCFDGGQVGYY